MSTRRAAVAAALSLVVLAGSTVAVTAVAGSGGSTDPRVINGEPVNGVYPWMVFVERRPTASGPFGRHCGGTLIAAHYVLTAAHCVAGSLADRFRLSIGQMDITTDEGETRFVSSIRIHPGYDDTNGQPRNDVALMRLSSASTKPPLPLAGPEHLSLWNDNDDKARVLGWGRREDDSLPAVLHKADVRIVPDARCDLTYELRPAVMVCAGGRDKDTCQGDSGGPMLVRPAGGAWRQVGATSFGFGCGDGFPGVYAQVGTDPLRRWILANSD